MKCQECFRRRNQSRAFFPFLFVGLLAQLSAFASNTDSIAGVAKLYMGIDFQARQLNSTLQSYGLDHNFNRSTLFGACISSPSFMKRNGYELVFTMGNAAFDAGNRGYALEKYSIQAGYRHNFLNSMKNALQAGIGIGYKHIYLEVDSFDTNLSLNTLYGKAISASKNVWFIPVSLEYLHHFSGAKNRLGYTVGFRTQFEIGLLQDDWMLGTAKLKQQVNIADLNSIWFSLLFGF